MCQIKMIQLEEELLELKLKKEREKASSFYNDLAARVDAAVTAKRRKSWMQYGVMAAAILFPPICMALSGFQPPELLVICYNVILLPIVGIAIVCKHNLNEIAWQNDYAEEMLRLCCVGSAIEQINAKAFIADYLVDRGILCRATGLYVYFQKKKALGSLSPRLPIATFLSYEEACAALGTLTASEQVRLEKFYG